MNYQSGILWWTCWTSLSCDLIKKAVRPRCAYRILCGSISILVLWHRSHTAQKHRTCDGWVLYNFKVYPIVPKNGNHSHIQEFLTWWSQVISTDVSLLVLNIFHLCVCNSLQGVRRGWVCFFCTGSIPFLSFPLNIMICGFCVWEKNIFHLWTLAISNCSAFMPTFQCAFIFLFRGFW